MTSYTGNLTPIDHAPFAAGGSNPVLSLVKPGGRFLFVINSGTGQVGTPNSAGFVAPSGAGISVFSIGGGGILTFEQNYSSQGIDPVWAALDSTGNFLYVLDKYSPYYNTTNPGTGLVAQNGSITSFSIAADTGRLTLVQNTTNKVLGTNNPTTVFETGANPTMTQIGAGNCLFTLSATSIYPYVVAGNGQLTTTATGSYSVTGSSNLSSINSTGSNTYLTDAGNNQIFSLTSGGSTCSFTPISGSQQTNVAGALTPVKSYTAVNGKYLYVLNQSSTNVATGSSTPVAQSTISAFNIDPTGKLSTLSDGTNNPYAVGSGPVCAVVDPTGQYLFVANQTDGTLTGKLIDQRFGFLSNLQRGSVFTTTMQPTCVSVSSNV